MDGLATPKGTNYATTSGGDYEEEVDDFFQEEEEEDQEEEEDDDTDRDREDEEEDQEDDDSEEEDEDEEDEDDDSDDSNEDGNTQFKNIPALLNEKYFGGKLNISELPEDLTREQEAEVVNGLFGKLMEQSQESLKQYQEVESLLQDEEVVEFLKYRKAGRSLKELVADKVVGSSDEDLVAHDLREKHPNWTDEDIQDQIEFWKNKGRFEGEAKLAKERREAVEAEQIKKANEAEDAKRREDEEKRQQDSARYSEFIKQQKEFHGMPIDEQMQRDLVTLATQINPKTGNVLIEDFLQKDQHIMAASMGILYMKKFAEIVGTKQGRKKASGLVNRLFDSPGELNTKKKNTSSHKSDLYYDAANSF